jgi:uncharacterized protein YciI
MKIIQILILFLLPNIVFAQININDFKFLSGKWKATLNNQTYYDSWSFNYEKNMLKGFGIKEKNEKKDTFETLKLYQLRDEIFYTVQDIENGKPIQTNFKLISNTSTSFTFQNNENEFPTSIAYNVINIDSVDVILNDKDNNPENQITFNFKRVNEYERFTVNINGENMQMRKYFLCLLKKGNNRNQPELEAKKIQTKHLNHIAEMARLNKISLAGPTESDTELSGIIVYNTATQAEAEYLQNKDEAIKSERLIMEILPWYSKEGAALSIK